MAAVLQQRLPAGYRISVTGRGEADPEMPNSSERNRARNRRVVISFTDAGRR